MRVVASVQLGLAGASSRLDRGVARTSREVAERRQREPGSPVAVAVAEHRQVHGQDDRAVAGGRGALDERAVVRAASDWT